MPRNRRLTPSSRGERRLSRDGAQRFAEVEDNLATLHWLGQESVDEDAAVTAAQHTLDVALNLYRQGADSYLEVVTAQTPLLRRSNGARPADAVGWWPMSV